MYQLVVAVCSVNVFDNGDSFQFRLVRDWKNTTSWRTNFGTRQRTWSFTVCGASYIKRTRLISIPRSRSASFGPADFPRRLIYYEWLLQQCRERPNCLYCILFTDKADSLAIQFSTAITLTFGPMKIHLVWHYILPNRLNAAQYLEFLKNVLKKQLDVEVPLGERVRMWYLSTNQWVGRNGPLAWSPLSPHLNPCDFCLWGWMK